MTYQLAQQQSVFYVIFNFEQYTRSIHESIGRFSKRAVANVFFNSKRKLSTDSAVAGGVKAFKKRQTAK